MPALDQVPRQELVVVHYDSPLRFMVKSRSDSGVSYTVDLGSDKYPYGECHCKDFIMTKGPAQLKGRRCWCQHIERARSAFTDWSIDAFKRQDKNKPQ